MNSALRHELSRQGIVFQLEHPLPVQSKDHQLDCGYRIDILVENRLIVEPNSVEQLKGIHEAQLLTCMKLAGMKIGLLMKEGILCQPIYC